MEPIRESDSSSNNIEEATLTVSPPAVDRIETVSPIHIDRIETVSPIHIDLTETVSPPNTDRIETAPSPSVGSIENVNGIMDSIPGILEDSPVVDSGTVHIDAVQVTNQPHFGFSSVAQIEDSTEETQQSTSSNETHRIPHRSSRRESRHSISNCQSPSESRLNVILCCTVCLDLPSSTCFQCTNGHLICEVCLNRILADAHLEDRPARCPSCRCEMSDEVPYVRNLAVEKAISELSARCQHCHQLFPRNILVRHEGSCLLKPCPCRFAVIGCTWTGKFYELTQHEAECSLASISGEEVARYVEEKRERMARAQENFCILDILSRGDNELADLKLKTYYTDAVTPRLYFESSRFTAFGRSWIVRAQVASNDLDQTEPNRAVSRSIVFQLVLKSRFSLPMTVHALAVGGPNSDVSFKSNIHKFDFVPETPASDFVNLGVSSEECDAILSTPTIYFRLLMANMSA